MTGSTNRKILFTFGGLPHYYNLVLNRLHAQANNEIVVIVPQKKGHTLGGGVHENTENIDFRKIHLPEYKAIWGKSFFKDFYKTLKQERPQILVTIWPYFLALVFNPILYWKIRRLGVKIILKEIPFNIPKKENFYDFFANGGVKTETLEAKTQAKTPLFYIKHTIMKWVYSIAFNRVDAHVDYTPAAFEVFGSYGVGKERIFIIYNSPDTDIILAEKAKIQGLEPILEANEYRIVHVGRLVKWKRVHMLIDVVAKLKTKYQKIELLIIGNGPEMENLKQQTEALQLQSNVRFVGAIYDLATLGRYLHTSQVYVLAGMGGLSINDAMCFDKPIICAEADGTETTLVRNGYNGYIFNNDNAADLQAKIELMLQNPQKTAEMGANSGKIIQDQVNIHTVVNNYQKAFNFVTC
jgi:glycosyltransferase involved in cell wall biosynthesis